MPEVKRGGAAASLSPYVNTNPDFYIDEIADVNPINPNIIRRIVIYNTLDRLIIGPAEMKNTAGDLLYSIGTDKDLTIYALNLTIVGDKWRCSFFGRQPANI